MSQSKVEVTQIDAMMISGESWIVESKQASEPANDNRILKTMKGPAILSERYTQQAIIIAKELTKTSKLNANSITEKESKRMVKKREKIAPSDTVIKSPDCFTKKEQKSIKKPWQIFQLKSGLKKITNCPES